MEILKLELQTRTKDEVAKDLLAQGMIPVEYYGKGVQNQSFKVDYQTFRRVYSQAGRSTVIDLVIDGKDSDISVLVHDVQRDPVSNFMTHVDFKNVQMGVELETSIPLEFTGMAPAVKELAGVLMTALTEVKVRCLPRNLVQKIEVPLESLTDFSVYIRVKDLNVPDTIAILNDEEDVVASVAPPRVEEEPEVVEGEEGAEGEGADDGEKKEDGGDEKKDEGGEQGGDEKGGE